MSGTVRRHHSGPTWRRAFVAFAISVVVLLASSGEGFEIAVADHVPFAVDTAQDTVDASPGDGICQDAGGRCSLRAAVMEANAHTGDDTIQFDFVATGLRTFTRTLAGDDEQAAATGDLDITESIAIEGGRSSLTVIDAAGLDRVFDVLAPATLTIRDVTITGGNATGTGGGILVRDGATLAAFDIEIASNSAATQGGGVYADGVAGFARVSIHGNLADAGAGIQVSGAAASLDLADSSVYENIAANVGGGVRVSAATGVIQRSAIYENSAGSQGGGLVVGSAGADVDLVASTVSGNSVALSGEGGGIHVGTDGVLLVQRSTVANNTASAGGQGIHANAGTGLVTLNQSILADSTGVDCGGPGPYASIGYSVIENPNPSCSAALAGTDVVSVDPSLVPLDRQGGLTQMHGIRPTSVAVDLVPSGSCPLAAETDQREVRRNIDGDNDGSAGCDAGAYEAGFLVNSTADTTDVTPGDGLCLTAGGECTLRAAIEEANSLARVQAIAFDIAGAGPHTITPATALPNISAQVIIDGYTEPGAQVNTATWDAGTNAVITIELMGSGGVFSGLNFLAAADGSVLRGLAVGDFDGPLCNVRIGADYTRIMGNFLGMDSDGLTPAGGLCGIANAGGTPANYVGSPLPADRNIISGLSGYGVDTSTTAAIWLQNNLIGVSRTGTGSAGVGNGAEGVVINGPSTIVGGFEPGAGNVITGNAFDGLLVDTADGALVLANHIGVDATGEDGSAGNSGDGVEVRGAAGTRIGAIGGGNVISGNTGHGVFLTTATADNNVVQSNLIGLDSDGQDAAGNGLNGIRIDAGITGTAVLNNTVGANGSDGLRILGDSTAVRNNYFGVALDGTTDRGNGQHGIHISGDNNVVESQGSFASGNLVSGNSGYGISISAGADGTQVKGNRIGTDAAGTGGIPNDLSGMMVQNSSNTTIGGAGVADRNVISGNANIGIFVSGSSGTLIAGNRIGTSPDGLSANPNQEVAGIRLTDAVDTVIGGATGITPGGACTGDCNVISANTLSRGITIDGAGTSNLDILNNFIGMKANGLESLGNSGDGIGVATAGDVLIEGNVISGNSDGISRTAVGASGLVISNNLIGTDTTGTVAIPTRAGGHGVNIALGSGGTIADNVIGGSAVSGIHLGAAASGVTITGNSIGTDLTGTIDLGNTGAGIELEQGSSGHSASGNQIAFNGGDGVVTLGAGGGVIDLSQNTIHDNGGLGIDLNNDGVSASNLPVIHPAEPGNGPVNLTLTTGAPGAAFRVELFTSATCDGTGKGEGRCTSGSQTL